MKRLLLALLLLAPLSASADSIIRIQGKLALSFNQCEEIGFTPNSVLAFRSATGFRGNLATTVVVYSGDVATGTLTFRGTGSARKFNGRRVLTDPSGLRISETIQARRSGRIYLVGLIGTISWPGGSCSYGY